MRTKERLSPHKEQADVYLSPYELLGKEIKTQRNETIPVNKIVLDAGIVDESHVDLLADSIKGQRGQISPIAVRARLAGEDLIHYDVIDGFHRSYALVALKKEAADAVVLYGCDDEELYDLRVLAANSVRSVQYVRVAKWMQYSFSQSEWSKKGLTLSQVFNLVMNDSSGRILGLTRDEADDAKEWVEKKSKVWNKPVSTIWQTARTIEAADPQLVLQVRLSGGTKGAGVLTPARLGAIATPLAGKYELQQKVAKVVLSQNIRARDALKLSQAVSEAADDPEKVESILASAEIYKPPERRYRGPKPLSQQVNLKEPSGRDDGRWWESLESLAENEREILIMIIEKGHDFYEIAEEMKISPQDVVKSLYSGLRKYGIFVDREIKIAEKAGPHKL